MERETTKDIAKIFEDGTLIDEALATAVRDAVRMHKLMGNPVAEWRDGKVVWVQPEDIQIPDEPA
jgi:hypothetical protein